MELQLITPPESGGAPRSRRRVGMRVWLPILAVVTVGAIVVAVGWATGDIIAARAALDRRPG